MYFSISIHLIFVDADGASMKQWRKAYARCRQSPDFTRLVQRPGNLWRIRYAPVLLRCRMKPKSCRLVHDLCMTDFQLHLLQLESFRRCRCWGCWNVELWRKNANAARGNVVGVQESQGCKNRHHFYMQAQNWAWSAFFTFAPFTCWRMEEWPSTLLEKFRRFWENVGSSFWWGCASCAVHKGSELCTPSIFARPFPNTVARS